MLQDYFEPTLTSRDYKEDKVMRSLLLVKDLPDVKAKVRLEKGQAKGTTDMVLEVGERHPFAGWLGYNNYGTPALGENRVGLTVAGPQLLAA